MKLKRTWMGVFPAVLVGSLLAIVAATPRAAGRAPAMPSAMAYPRCDHVLQQSGGTSAFTVAPLAGVNQPIAFVGNVAACSLTIDPTYSSGRLELVQWDPLTLAPDPTTIALRTRAFDVSAILYSRTRADFYPPVVTRTLAHVAEPPRQTTAIDWRVTASYGGQTLRFESGGAPEIPAALQYPAGGGPRFPLPGAHPVLSHAVCGGDDELQGLHVIQSVMTTNSLSDTSCYDLIQRFRVPVRSRLRWVEVAFGVPPRPQYFDPLIAILDAEGASEPPVSLPPSLVEAPYAHFVTTPFWGSHFDFDHLITLEPGRDYWLLARVEHLYVLYSRTLTGGESPDFTASIGPSFRRTTPDGGWIAEPGQALCFRLIGEPLGGHPLPRGRLREQRPEEAGLGAQPSHTGSRSTAAATLEGAPGGASEPGALRLRVAPNPSRGAALVSWSGAAGPMRVDVHDAQGRRVGGFEGIARGEGRWLWNGALEDGRPAPAGVYFVRATDGAGRNAGHRVVLIR